jgi:outer membrane protein assembly factor BamB
VGRGELSPPLYLRWEEKVVRSPSVDLALAGRGLVVGSTDQRVRVVDLVSGGTFWEKKVRGTPSTAPVVIDDQILVGYDAPESGLTAFAVSNGDRLWERRDLAPRGGLLARGDLVFVATAGKTLDALELGTGETVWSVDTGVTWPAPLASHGDLLILPAGRDSVFAHRVDDGERVWAVPLPGGSRGGAAVQGGSVYVAGLTGEVLALDARTGAVRWRRDLATRIFAAPLLVDDELYVCGLNGRLYALATGTGQPRWSLALDGVCRGTPVVAGNLLAVTTMTATCQLIDRVERRVVYTLDLRRPVAMGPLLVDRYLYAVDDEGRIYAYESS